MSGKETQFLEFNRGEIFWNVLHMEGHFRNVKPGFKAEDLACIVKHSADVEGHCNEAVSHALVVQGKVASDKYRKLRDMIRSLRVDVQAGKVTPDNGILRTREVRAYFEGFNPAYDISKCASCGDPGEAEKILSQVEVRDIRASEDGFAASVVDQLASEYGVKPEVTIDDRCNAPDKGVYQGGKITVCRGGTNAHVIAHEYAHAVQDSQGKTLDEAEAEAMAEEMMHKTLYSRNANYSPSESRMVAKAKVREVAVLYGGQHVGKGVSEALKWADTKYPMGVAGVKVSLIGKVVGTVGGIYGFLKLKAPYDTVSALVGGYLSTGLWDDVAEMLAPAPVARFPAASARFPTLPTRASAFNGASVKVNHTVEATPIGTAPVSRFVMV